MSYPGTITVLFEMKISTVFIGEPENMKMDLLVKIDIFCLVCTIWSAKKGNILKKLSIFLTFWYNSNKTDQISNLASPKRSKKSSYFALLVALLLCSTTFCKDYNSCLALIDQLAEGIYVTHCSLKNDKIIGKY